MTDKAKLRSRVKRKLSPQAQQKCLDGPGHLAVYVARIDTKGPVAGVKVTAAGPSPDDRLTDSEGWVIFRDRDPGDYQAKIAVPETPPKLRVRQGTQSGTVTACEIEVLEFEVSPPPKVGVALSFHPVLFKKDEYPASTNDFYVLTDPDEFLKKDLLADGECEAVIRIHLVKLDDRGKLVGNRLVPATDAEHFNEGHVILQLSTGDFGVLSYGNQNGTKISIPVKDIPRELPTDKNKSVLFKTSREIGQTTVTVSIENNMQYEECPLPDGWRKHSQLTVGSRRLSKDLLGYDARKAQWFLHKAGFVSYTEQERGVNGPRCEWSAVKRISTDGEFGAGSMRCLRDFQRVARGKFRNQTHRDVTVTLNEKSAEVTPGVIDEFLEWRAKGYTVEPYNGVVVLKVAEGGIDATARIVYGALVQGDDPKGFVEIAAPIGHSKCHWEGREFVVADEIRSAIKLFLNEELKFRLHDADPGGPPDYPPAQRKQILDDEYLNPDFVAKIKSAIQTLRREQTIHTNGANARDVRLAEGYRSGERQDWLYQKGRYWWTENGTVKFHPPDPLPATANNLQHRKGEPCEHDAETLAIGKCAVHEWGDPPSQPCQHDGQLRALGTCADHPQGNPSGQACHHPAEKRAVGQCKEHPIGSTVTRAQGQSMSSWHQFGLAVDLIFNNDVGDPVWLANPYWARNGAVAKESPRSLHWGGDWAAPYTDRPHIQLPAADKPDPGKHNKKYNDTEGSVLQKLQAVWGLLE